MFHNNHNDSNDISSDEGEEEQPVVAFDLPIYYLTPYAHKVVSEFLLVLEGGPYYLEPFDNLSRGDIKFHDFYKSPKDSEYLLVPAENLTERLITGGKIKNDYFPQSPNNNLTKKRNRDINFACEEEESRNGSNNNNIKNNNNKPKPKTSGIRKGSKCDQKCDRPYCPGKMKFSSKSSSSNKMKNENFTKKYRMMMEEYQKIADPNDFLRIHVETKIDKDFDNEDGDVSKAEFLKFKKLNKYCNADVLIDIYKALSGLIKIKNDNAKTRVYRKKDKILKLADNEKLELKNKIGNMNLHQIHSLKRDYLSQNFDKDGIKFSIDAIPLKILPKFKKFIEDCDEFNKKTEGHLNWSQQMKKNQMEGRANRQEEFENMPVEASSLVCPMSPGVDIPPNNPLLGDDSISESISSSSDESASLSELLTNNIIANQFHNSHPPLDHNFSDSDDDNNDDEKEEMMEENANEYEINRENRKNSDCIEEDLENININK